MSIDEDPTAWDKEPIAAELDTQPEIVEWTMPRVLASLGLPPDAARERVLMRARDAIDNDEISMAKIEVLVTSGYPELDPDLDEDDSGLAEDDYEVGPSGVRLAS